MAKKIVPPQQQSTPGSQEKMHPYPQTDDPNYKGSGKLQNKVSVITGGDSGIGQAVAIAFAKEGCSSAIIYLSEHEDAKNTRRIVESYGQSCLLIPGDITSFDFCKEAIETVYNHFKRIDCLINNAAEQHPKDDIREITPQQLARTFQTNIFSMFYLSQLVLPHLKEGDTIINTSSVTAYRGSDHLLDYASTKGAIVSFTRSFAKNIADRKIRVNAVAPGPVWTPLIPSTFDKEKVSEFGADTLYKRPAHPYEIAPSYVFLASTDSIFMTGQVLHPNGGEIVNA